MRVETVLSMFNDDRESFHRFVCDDDAARVASGVAAEDIERLLGAVTLVLAQQGVDERARLGARARSATLAWSLDHSGLTTDALMAAFGIEGPGAWRSAVSRARRLVATDEQVRASLDRAAMLALARPIRVSTGV
jgi:hypothetical protein